MGLKAKAFTGFLWSSAGTLGNGFVNLLVTIVLARILTPEDFAIVALLTVFVTVSNVLVDSGFSQAIIRDDDLCDQDLSSVFLFNMTLSICLYGLLFAASPYIAIFYDLPKLAFLSRIVFLVIIFNAFSIIQNASLKRNLEFAKVEKSSVLGSLCAGLISIIMAFSGFGIWSLVANMVLMPLFRSIFLWIFSKWRPKLVFSFLSVKKYFNFSIFLTIQSLVDVIVTNLNTLFIGKVYTKNDLGYYSQAGKLDSYIVNPLGSVLDKVVYPIFAKVKNDQNILKEGYRQMIGLLLFVTMPVMLFVAFNAENTIAFFFGNQWLESGIYLQLLSIMGLFQIVHKVFTNLIIVKGNTKIMLIFAIIKQSLRVIALIFTIHISVKAMVQGFVISGIIGSLLYIGLGMYYLRYGIQEFIIDNYKTIIVTILSIIATMIVDYIVDIKFYIEFILQVCIMCIAYLSFSIICRNQYGGIIFNQFIGLIRKNL